MKIKQIFITLLIALIIAMNLLCISVFADDKNQDEETTSDAANVKIYSEAGILMDAKTGKILYNKNAKEKKYPASTTKILTAIIVLENCKNLDEMATVDVDSINSVPSGYTVAALQVGEEISVKHLLQLLLVHSANDAANVLAKHVSGSIESFSDMMNVKAKEIGCENSHFVNPNGKHDPDHYSTAYDLSLIMNYCMKNETFRSFSSAKSCIIPATNKYDERIFTNSNELLVLDTRDVPTNYYYPYAIAGKTGYTAEAKNCLVSVAEKDGLQLICTVLGGIRTDEGLSARFCDTKQLFEYGYNTYTIKKLRQKGASAKQIEIPNATKETKDLDLLITNDIDVLIKQKNMYSKIEPVFELNDNLSAPINKGDVVGKIKYSIEGIDYSADLIASHDVEKNNILFFILELILIAGIIFAIYKLKFDKNPKNKNRRNHNSYNFNFIKFKNKK